MSEFLCNACMRWKPVALRTDRRAGGRYVCSTCCTNFSADLARKRRTRLATNRLLRSKPDHYAAAVSMQA